MLEEEEYLQQFPANVRTGLGIGQCMVVPG